MTTQTIARFPRTALRSLALAGLLVLVGLEAPAEAIPAYLTQFNAAYGTLGRRLSSCGICHVNADGSPNASGGGPRNQYSNDWKNSAIGNSVFTASDLETRDSDGDD